ncbi:Protein CBG26110 [Caenorhabditis briggsae]|uniref:Protein CBG26109 n=1 Tax=Caenorhabditis briggsae TaxID=6238 RepID=G2J6W4_CAEBR|nr:Protein CBG26109 [Caenorhabditis briggsae]XP_045099653.1 Protein CBG26110 [Caenorhabditis briggsae]CAS00092.1 Protein CBG26109 [Caenorhabditis briggsae]CAS00093.1 Protein CBG26110 [Caenorhabditis briggsae]
MKWDRIRRKRMYKIQIMEKEEKI